MAILGLGSYLSVWAYDGYMYSWKLDNAVTQTCVPYDHIYDSLGQIDSAGRTPEQQAALACKDAQLALARAKANPLIQYGATAGDAMTHTLVVWAILLIVVGYLAFRVFGAAAPVVGVIAASKVLSARSDEKPATTQAPSPDPYERLSSLNKLRKEGAITDREYEAEKIKVLQSPK